MTVMFKFLLLLPLLSQAFVINNDASVREYSETLTFVDNTYWAVAIEVGNPGQRFNVVIDTTTSTLWLGGPNCTTAACKKASLFQPYKSTTYIDTPLVVDNNDHNGFEKGVVACDSVQLGSDKSKSIVVPGNNFALLRDIPLAYQTAGVDGVLGLGYPANSMPHTSPPFYQAASNSLTTSGIFTIWLEDQYQTSDQGTHGVIYFGNYDPLHCPTMSVLTIPQTTGSDFKFTTSSVLLNNASIISSSYQTRIDTTSPYLSMGTSSVQKILTLLGLNTKAPLPAYIPCDKKFLMTFKFTSGLFDVTHLNLIVKQADGRCILNIVPNADGGSQIVLGTPFLRGRCSYFDMLNQKIGFSDALSH